MIITLFVAVALVVAATLFAAPATTGKILAVDAGSVRIAIDGEKPSWIKEGAPVKFKDGVGKILEVSAEGVTPAVITVKTKKASEMKAGEAISFEKGKAVSGC
jgi:D-serine deaminase-like pyridoxal phosphate-dependent protein